MHKSDQISRDTDTSDLWPSEILSKKEATFVMQLVAKYAVSFQICCIFHAQYLRAPKIWRVSLFWNLIKYIYIKLVYWKKTVRKYLRRRSEILSMKYATYLKWNSIFGNQSHDKCCFFLAQYLRGPKVWRVSISWNLVTFIHQTSILKKTWEQISVPPIKRP